jgi:superfamily II DNA or RNA helicase
MNNTSMNNNTDSMWSTENRNVRNVLSTDVNIEFEEYQDPLHEEYHQKIYGLRSDVLYGGFKTQSEPVFTEQSNINIEFDEFSYPDPTDEFFQERVYGGRRDVYYGGAKHKKEETDTDSLELGSDTPDEDINYGIEASEYNTEDKMMEDHTFPSPTQENFQTDIYTKRDYYIHAIPHRDKFTNYQEVKEYRDNICARAFKLNEHQASLSNFINPNTPYRGLLMFHGTGTGKTCAAVAIAEKFKPMVEKYGTRIHVLVPGPLMKQNFLGEIIKCTDETYMKIYQDKTMVIDEVEMIKMKKNALNIVSQYYRIMSYRSFYKKVLGEKIIERKSTKDNKMKIAYRKTDAGDYERDISVDRLYNLDNTLLIVDEAHNLTDNEYGSAVRKIIENSKNLRIVLLTATPMKNLADDIVELINYLRPPGQQMERDKIFNSSRNYQMEFKDGGRDYLRKMVRGYVSFLRGNDPLTFAERIDVGEIPKGLNFTKVIRCIMLPFQLKTYMTVVEVQDDSLDRRSEAAANFVFPGLPRNKEDKGLEGYYGITNIADIKSQLKNNADVLTKRIASTVLKDYDIKDPASLMYLTDNNKIISGDIFKEEYLKHFSIKFYTALMNINSTVYGKRGPGILFIYSNLVKVGIELFQEVLQRNGYLEFQENANNYNIKKDTRCYFCEHKFDTHYHLPKNIPKHDFFPATYISVTGKSDENMDQIPEEKHRILKNISNNIENKDGKFIKVILGSKVMNEGITLRNIKEIHVLDVHFNLGKVDQVIGRGIRWCTHYDIINEENPYPTVEVHKYVVSLETGLSTEEKLYQKAELKYKLVKETERIIEEEAIDCPLNRNGNIFPEELERYKNCGSKDNPCPAVCGYMSCDFKCGDKLLNAKYYDAERNIYRKISKEELDYSTYNNSLAGEEIDYAKNKIKEMFRINHMYTLRDILKYIKKSYPVEKRDLFDDYYVYQALNDLIPTTSNDFNNFKDTVTDKFNRPGYIIYRSKFYIFQPFEENESLPMYYRRNYKSVLHNKLSLKDYIQNTIDYKKYKEIHKNETEEEPVEGQPLISYKYDFDSIQEYYDSRDEFEYVGIIDQESTRKKIKQVEEIHDEFKIRGRRPKVLSKKRETGVPSFKGAVCKTSKDKNFLLNIAKLLNIEIMDVNVRETICDQIRDKLFALEKYSTTKLGNKITYLIVPANHKTIPFPLNLEDRIKHILDGIQKETKMTVDSKIHVEKVKGGKYSDIHYVKYTVELDKSLDKFHDVLELYGATNKGGKWIIEVG